MLRHEGGIDTEWTCALLVMLISQSTIHTRIGRASNLFLDRNNSKRLKLICSLVHQLDELQEVRNHRQTMVAQHQQR